MGWDISFSPSKLNLLKECKRCFYDANVLKIERPRGIFPSLPGGVDRVMKELMDCDRATWPSALLLEPALAGKTLWGTKDQINKLRNWRSGFKAIFPVRDKVVSLIGAIDDAVIEPDGTLSPYDTKTKGSEPKDDGAQYYQAQVDLYALLFQANGHRPSGNAYLCYWFPIVMSGEEMQWGHTLYTLTAEPDRALALLDEAVEVVTGGQPDANPSCEYCRFAQARVEAALSVVK